jgi:glucose/mannose transport system substrate-binding protein
MLSFRQVVLAASMLACATAARAVAPRAEVIHWWTSGGESAAIKVVAARYQAAGGVWIDTAIPNSEVARPVAVNRIIGSNPPAAAQFNISKQYLDLIEEDMLSNVDALAASEKWDSILPEPVRKVIKVGGHYYAVPLSIHMPSWIWYSKEAFNKAGIRQEPRTVAELFAALDKLKAAGIVPLAHGGQAWQENIVFMTMLANVGGKDLYLKVLRDRDQKSLRSEGMRRVLLAFKRLSAYVDHGTAGRTWNGATAMLIEGRAGVQIMGDWVKAEITTAGMQPGREIGCIASLHPDSPVVIQGDAFIFPKSDRQDVRAAQALLARVMVARETQLQFSRIKGSVAIGADVDPARLDPCSQRAQAAMKEEARHVGNGETYLTAGQNEALTAALAAYWDGEMPVEEAQNRIIAALRR